MEWDYEKLVNVLKTKGHRITNIRSAILKLLLRNQHVSINNIIRILKKESNNKINIMSVYNTLDLFLQLEIIYFNVFDGRNVVFELAEPVLLHLVCESCHKFFHLDNNSFQENLLKNLSNNLPDFQFNSLYWKLEIHGLCEFCQKNRLLKVNS